MTVQSDFKRYACAIALGLLITAGASAQVPEQINYQGYLADSAGNALTDPVQVRFSLYGVETGGVPLWTDTLAIVPSQGLFTAPLGNPMNPFPVGLFDTPLYLGIQVETDAEMTPRVALTAAPYSNKAADAETVGGMTAASLDQSGDVATLATDVGAAQASLTQLATDVTTVQAGVDTNLSAIDQLQVDVGQAESDIGQLQSDLAATDADLTTVENTLPTLQSRVTGTCSGGSSIRVINAAGTVTCELDDTGPWSVNANSTYVTSGNVGIGTSQPLATLMVDAPAATDALRVRVGAVTRLLVNDNGGVSVGTATPAASNGLFVAGDVGVGTATPAARLSLWDVDWQMTLLNPNAGGNEWHVGSSADSWGAGGGKLVFSPTSSSGNAAMVMDENRNVGISTVAPETRLHVKGGSDVSPAGGGYLTLGDTGGTNIALDNNEIMARNNGAAASLALNAQGGEVTINANGDLFGNAARIVGTVEFAGSSGSLLMEPQPTGGGTESTIFLRPDRFEGGGLGKSSYPFFSAYARTFYAQLLSSYQAYSDRSLKRDVKPIAGALDVIERLQGVSYAMRKHPHDDGARERSPEEQFSLDHQLGFIAQDVEAVLPQLVQTEPETGLKTVGYMGVIPLLVEAIKEQQRQIETQQATLDAQQAEIAALRRLFQ